jgi:hypothetical protein
LPIRFRLLNEATARIALSGFMPSMCTARGHSCTLAF